jgi:hypothetical protein
MFNLTAWFLLSTPSASANFFSCIIWMEVSIDWWQIILKSKIEINLIQNPYLFSSLENVDVTFLTNSVDAVHGLCLELRVPVNVDQDQVVASNQIYSSATSGQGEQQHL